MTWICGYRDGTPQGRAFQMPDWTYVLVTEVDAAEIADGISSRPVRNRDTKVTGLRLRAEMAHG